MEQPEYFKIFSKASKSTLPHIGLRFILQGPKRFQVFILSAILRNQFNTFSFIRNGNRPDYDKKIFLLFVGIYMISIHFDHGKRNIRSTPGPISGAEKCQNEA